MLALVYGLELSLFITNNKLRQPSLPVSLQTNVNANACGGCDSACPTRGEGLPAKCEDGVCAPCESGKDTCWTDAGLACVETDTDINNCGGCGKRTAFHKYTHISRYIIQT